MTDPWPLPEPNDTTRFYWGAAAKGCLSIQRCGPCQKLQYLPEVC